VATEFQRNAAMRAKSLCLVHEAGCHLGFHPQVSLPGGGGISERVNGRVCHVIYARPRLGAVVEYRSLPMSTQYERPGGGLGVQGVQR
jgi:hypothetical protein